MEYKSKCISSNTWAGSLKIICLVFSYSTVFPKLFHLWNASDPRTELKGAGMESTWTLSKQEIKKYKTMLEGD